MRPIFILPSVILISSCVLGPEPGSPEAALPSSIRGDVAPHGVSFGDKAWHKVFTDSTLRTLIARALQNNPDLVAATYRIQAARANLLATEYQRDGVQTLLVTAVASTYIDLKNLDERLAISRRTVESRKGSLELVTARRDGGISSDLEVGQAEALLS